jgi:hypothetical protein
MSEKKVRAQRQHDKILTLLNEGKKDEAFAFIDSIGGRERLKKIDPYLDMVVYGYFA